MQYGMNSSQCGEIYIEHLTEGHFSLGNVLPLCSFSRCMPQCCKLTCLLWKIVLSVFLDIQTYVYYEVAGREALPLVLMVDRDTYILLWCPGVVLGKLGG